MVSLEFNQNSLKTKYLLFFIIVLVNVLLKSFFGKDASFNYDEIISVKNTLLDFGHIKHEAEWDNNPPFYYYCLWIWHKVFPTNEFYSRLLSVLFVSFAIGCSFLFTQKIFNLKVAVYVSILLTVSNFLCYYSAEARAYSLVLLMALLSSIQFFNYIKKPSIVNLILLAVLNFLIIYSHYIAGLIILWQYVFILIYNRDRVFKSLGIQTGIIIILTFLRFTKKQFLHILNFNNTGTFWLQKASFEDFVNAINSLVFNNWGLLIFVILCGVFVFSFMRDKGIEKQGMVYCFMIGFCSIFVLFSIGMFKAVFLDRYLIFCVPFIMMLLSYQISKYKLQIVIVAILFIIQVFFYKKYKESNMDYRGIAEIVKTNIETGDYVIINTKDNLLLFEYYYDRKAFFEYKDAARDSLNRSRNIYGFNELENLKEMNFIPGKKIFLIQSFHTINQPNNLFFEYFSLKYKKIYFTTGYNGVEFSLFKT